MIKYSFIIPVKEINDYIHESVPKILEIPRDDFEVIIYPDKETEEEWPKTRQIASGPGGPAMKRNLSIRDAVGEILIFVDDDAYPENNFLEILDKDFFDKNIVAVGGPAMTPKNDSFWQKVSGAIFISNLSFSHPERYVPIGKKRHVDDWPSVNLSVKKSDFIAINGFVSNYWPGEDTKLCLDLINKTQKKILYDPELIVWHHRRSGLWPHLKQVGNYGLHRGFFAKKYPQTSLKLKYFLPSLFLLYLIIGPIAGIYFDIAQKLYLLGWILYTIILIKIFFNIYKYEKNIAIILNALYYVFFTHLYYGLRFMQGFIFTRELKSKYR